MSNTAPTDPCTHLPEQLSLDHITKKIKCQCGLRFGEALDAYFFDFLAVWVARMRTLRHRIETLEMFTGCEMFASAAPQAPVPAKEKPVCKGLWREQPETREGKYLVKRRDGTVVEWPHFVLGARDPNSPAALRAYADSAFSNNMDVDFVAAVRRLADEFEAYRHTHGAGDPDRGRHRKDDPATIAEMRKGQSA